MVVMGIGVGLFYSSITTAAVTALDPSRSSLAGRNRLHVPGGGRLGRPRPHHDGVHHRLRGPAAETTSAGSGLSGEEIDTLHGALAGTESAPQILARFSGATAERLIELVRDAFAAGMQWSFRLVALLALCGLVVSVLFVGGSLLRRDDEPAASPRTAG